MLAELVLSEIIFLSRQLGDRNNEMHRGVWNKVFKNCYEVRGKKLGIVGYGHIGSQLSVLAEALGMQVYFYDVLQLMPLGSAKPVATLPELLSMVDVVTFHVPETPDTKDMVGEKEIRTLRPGSYLINASRGSVIQIAPLTKALRDGHLGGAAIDVFPSEPERNGAGFESELLGCPNTLLTPHIGGSTEEAQCMIGIEVGNAIIRFMSQGATLGAVNFPQIELRPSNDPTSMRVLFVHDNVPGVLKSVNNVLSDYNVERQTSESKGDLAYLVADVIVGPGDAKTDIILSNLYHKLSTLPHGISTRLIQ
ncbi:D-3-phosphoglycerate dehydrogenase 2 [Massospora cicadina]|nr:D-3-phosphoglycerate dehydrogenase 2 [Massospora cicadina]